LARPHIEDEAVDDRENDDERVHGPEDGLVGDQLAACGQPAGLTVVRPAGCVRGLARILACFCCEQEIKAALRRLRGGGVLVRDGDGGDLVRV
jgi:hypothetical protein